MTILSESTQISFIVPIAIIGIIALALSFLLFWASSDANEYCFVLGILMLFIGIVFIFVSYNPYTKYRALIDDKYTVKELYESYEIVGREGEMYILRAKESDEDD